MNNQITLHETQLDALLAKAAEVGARRALIGAGLESPTLSYNEAVRRFGKAAMMYWRKAGLLKPIQQGIGATHRYSVTEMVALALSENRNQYLTMAERRQA